MKVPVLVAACVCFITLSDCKARAYSDSLIREKGRFEEWQVQKIKESGLIGGNIKTIYRMSSGDTLIGRDAYQPDSESVFAPCNIVANVVGIVKGSNSVFPEKRGDGYCARMSVIMEKVKVLGMINMEVLVQGTILSGSFHEPIRDTKGAYAKMDCGIPFTRRPKAVSYDYKAIVGNPITRSTGFSPQKELGGADYAFIAVYLQHRTEDEKGRVTAKRVGTAYKLITGNQEDWINGEQLTVHYGDITQEDFYIPEMGLKNEDILYYCRNSKDRIVPIYEDGWADADTEPTHVIVWLSSSCGEAFYGGLGNTLWIDNFSFVY